MISLGLCEPQLLCNHQELDFVKTQRLEQHHYVGILVVIARERSEAIYLGYVFRTYGTKVLACLIGICREDLDCIRATRFSWDKSVARGVREEACGRARSTMEQDPHSFVLGLLPSRAAKK
jgi:hypothetical protein